MAGVPLAAAREAAGQARKVLAFGHNPIEERRRAKARVAERVTFGESADDLIRERTKGFRNEKHAAQWSSTINTYRRMVRIVDALEG